MPYVFKERRAPEPWRQFRARAKTPILLPFYASEFVFDWTAYLLSRWSLLEVLEYAGSFSVLVAVIFYFAESGERTQARHYQAWQVINTAQGKPGSGGRSDALEQLHEDHVALVAVDVSKAFLQGVRLENANLLRADFHEADVRDAKLAGAGFELANLHNANFRGADLRHANLRDADLGQADLTGADIAGASLDRADLSEADLAGLLHWQDQTSWNRTNITRVENAPDGFIQWVTRHGAVVEPSPQTATQPTSAPSKP